jgi:hypothetical protein
MERMEHLGTHPGLVASLDVLDLEVAAIGDEVDCLDAQKSRSRRRSVDCPLPCAERAPCAIRPRWVRCNKTCPGRSSIRAVMS